MIIAIWDYSKMIIFKNSTKSRNSNSHLKIILNIIEHGPLREDLWILSEKDLSESTNFCFFGLEDLIFLIFSIAEIASPTFLAVPLIVIDLNPEEPIDGARNPSMKDIINLSKPSSSSSNYIFSLMIRER